MGDVDAGQPLRWTFVEFEVRAEDAPTLADAPAEVIDPDLGWYCSYGTSEEMFVVFGGRAFRCPRGDATRRAEVEEFARSRGVPEGQLDWES